MNVHSNTQSNKIIKVEIKETVQLIKQYYWHILSQYQSQMQVVMSFRDPHEM